MHDAKGRSLAVGDTVLIPAVVKSCSPGDYCTLDVETVGVMPGNGSPTTFSALNTKQVYRANEVDLPVSSIDTETRDGKVYLA